MRHPIIRQQLGHRRVLRGICRTGARNAVEILDGFLPSLEGLRLLAAQTTLERLAEQVIHDIGKELFMGIQTTAEITVKHYDTVLERAGFSPLNPAASQQLLATMVRKVTLEAFKGATPLGRLAKWEQTLKRGLRYRLAAAWNTRQPARVLRQAVGSSFISNMPVAGGSIFGAMDRLIVSEESRVYHETSVGYFLRAGIGYARFTITEENQRHDICDIYANLVVPQVAAQLRGSGIDPAGVYPVNGLPGYPHPRALYYLDPIFLVGFNPTRE